MADYHRYRATLDLQTTRDIQILDITDRVQRLVHDSTIYTGKATIISAHTTAGLIAQEAEENLLRDFEDKYRKLVKLYGLADVLLEGNVLERLSQEKGLFLGSAGFTSYVLGMLQSPALGKGRDHFTHDRIEQRTCPENEPVNGHAHLLISNHTQHNLVFLVEEGKLKTYDWKRILFVEADGPCPRDNKPGRKVDVFVEGNKQGCNSCLNP